MNAIAKVEDQSTSIGVWSREEVDVIKDLICPGASDAELRMFAKVCERTGLDCFSRQIYGLMRWDKRAKREKLSIQTSIDGFRLTAERTGKYAGQLGPQWCGPDGVWRDVWLESSYPSAARVGVLRSDWQEPMWSVARWDSYVQKFKNRENGGEFVGEMWQRMPDVMIAKCAESLGLRRAFPAELSGLYTAEEMAQAEHEQQPTVHVVEPISIARVQSEPSKPRESTPARPVQPEPEPDPAEEERARAMERPKWEAEYTRLAALAVERGHKDVKKIEGKKAQDLDDEILEASIASLQRWEAKLPPVEDDDTDAAF